MNSLDCTKREASTIFLGQLLKTFKVVVRFPRCLSRLLHLQIVATVTTITHIALVAIQCYNQGTSNNIDKKGKDPTIHLPMECMIVTHVLYNVRY